MQIDIMDDVVKNFRAYLILFGTGAIIWFIGRVIPPKIEKTKVWKLVIRGLPACFAAGLSAIPGLQPLPVLSQSILFGIILGSFSQMTYGLLRKAIPEKIQSLLGSKKQKKGVEDK